LRPSSAIVIAAVLDVEDRRDTPDEPKESILGRFDVTAISRYFPEFERVTCSSDR
jgi:hypothetical protein